jgi:pyrimidine operon attenuation protein/uracil phosphoribosyltransferase
MFQNNALFEKTAMKRNMNRIAIEIINKNKIMKIVLHCKSLSNSAILLADALLLQQMLIRFSNISILSP